MYFLPNDVLDIIYKKKHELELKDVHDQLLFNHECKINDIYKCIEFFKNTINYCQFILTNFSATDIYPFPIIFSLYGALLNDGIIDEYDFLNEIIDFRKHVGLDEQYESRFIQDVKSVLFDDTICMNRLLEQYKWIFEPSEHLHFTFGNYKFT